jgi:hypothetical protein
MNSEIKNKIDDALYSFYLEADKDTINDSLKDDIENLDEYEKMKKHLLFLAKATLNKKRNETLLKIAGEFQEALRLKTEKPIAILKQIIQNNPSFAFYKNLDKLSKEDIIEIIKDKNLVELIEQLDKNEKKQ